MDKIALISGVVLSVLSIGQQLYRYYNQPHEEARGLINSQHENMVKFEKSIVELTHVLDLLKKDLETSIKDKQMLRSRVDNIQKVQNKHGLTLAKHQANIQALCDRTGGTE